MGNMFTWIHVHLKNQFKSKTHLNKAMIISGCWLGEEKTFISFLRKEWSLFILSWDPFSQGCFVPSLVEIGPVVLENKMKLTKLMQRKQKILTVQHLYKNQRIDLIFCPINLKINRDHLVSRDNYCTGNSQTKGPKDTAEQHLYKDQNKLIF